MIKIDFSELNSFYNAEAKMASNFKADSFKLTDEGRMSDPIFKSIGYPSKIFYKNIQDFIRAYTKPDGIVIDSCCGSGSTGIASLFEKRKCILIDNSPQAVNMACNLIDYIDISKLEKEYKLMVKALEDIINDIYYTKTIEGYEGYAEVIIASNVYLCPECNEEIVLYKNDTGKRSEYKCITCGTIINISKNDIKEKRIEQRREVEVKVKFKNNEGKTKSETKRICDEDLKIWNEKFVEYSKIYGDYWCPDEKIVYNRAYPRKGGWPGFAINSTVSDLFPKKNLLALKILNHYIENEIKDERIQSFMKFIFTECLFRVSSRLFVTSGIKTVYHIPPVGKEQNVFTVFKRKYKSIVKGKKALQELSDASDIKNIKIIKGNSRDIGVLNDSIDYAFIDPPYGGMVPYAELNLFYSAWLREKEDLENEIIIPMDFEKKEEYIKIWGLYIEEAFREIYRVLRPGAYFTVVFHSTFSSIWNELKDVMINRLGFDFINIISNERGNTFHTNQMNDTNPESAFITYRKPLEKDNRIRTEVFVSIFEKFDLEFLKKERNFREIQTKFIFVAYENKDMIVPTDDEIKIWLDDICVNIEGKYKIK